MLLPYLTHRLFDKIFQILFCEIVNQWMLRDNKCDKEFCKEAQNDEHVEELKTTAISNTSNAMNAQSSQPT